MIKNDHGKDNEQYHCYKEYYPYEFWVYRENLRLGESSFKKIFHIIDYIIRENIAVVWRHDF